jgi:hypothetical protein
MTHIEKFKTCFSRLSAMAASFLPAGYKDALIGLAHEVDQLRAEINELKKEKTQ